MTIKLDRQGHRRDGGSDGDLIVALAQQEARRIASAETALTDSSGGTDSAIIVGAADVLADAAASGTDRAGEASSQAAIAAVRDGIGEIVDAANTVLAALGLPVVTDNSGAEAADGTLAVISAVTGAATGVQAAECEVLRLALNDYLFVAANLVNRVAVAVGVDEVAFAVSGAEFASTIAVIDETATGTAADPGVSAAAFDAAMADYADDIAALATAFNAAVSATIVPRVVVQA